MNFRTFSELEWKELEAKYRLPERYGKVSEYECTPSHILYLKSIAHTTYGLTLSDSEVLTAWRIHLIRYHIEHLSDFRTACQEAVGPPPQEPGDENE